MEKPLPTKHLKLGYTFRMKKFILLFILSTSFVLAKDLSVSLSPETTTIEAGKTARVRVNFSQAPKKFSATDIAVDGGTIDSVRKLSTRVYLAVVRASEDAKEVELQIQADAIRDNEGDLNENASNSVRLKIVANTQKLEAENKINSEKVKLETEKTLNTLLNAVTQSAKNNPPVSTPAPQVQYYNCNGQAIPTTQQCVQNTQQIGGYYDAWGNWVPAVQTAPIVAPTVVPYNSYNAYSSYSPYSTYGVTPVYDATYYANYYDYYGYYPQSYYSSPYYSKYRRSTLLDLLDW